ncbi:MAG: LysM peptidoglycan-binding domain-containing protein [Sporichthyaceae bacterium]
MAEEQNYANVIRGGRHRRTAGTESARPRTRPCTAEALNRLAAPPSWDPLHRLAAPAVLGVEELRDGWEQHRRRSVAVVAGVVASAVALPPAMGLSISSAAIPPAPTPMPAFALPSQVEALSPYLGQVSCDPHAKPGVAGFAQLVLSTYAHGRSAGISRSCGVGGQSEHKEGRAWDWGLDPNVYEDAVAGQRVLDFLLANNGANARRFGIMYIIWNNRIWAAYRAADGWRPYTGADPHTSHMHLSFSWAGAMQRTSWWTGNVAPTEFGPCQKFIGEAVPAYGQTVNLKPCEAPKKKPDPDDKPKDKDDKKDKKKEPKHKKKDKDKDKNDKPDAASEPRFRTVTVQAGDTLAALARTYGTTAAAIAKANKLANPDRIFIGQKLRIPRS